MPDPGAAISVAILVYISTSTLRPPTSSECMPRDIISRGCPWARDLFHRVPVHGRCARARHLLHRVTAQWTGVHQCSLFGTCVCCMPLLDRCTHHHHHHLHWRVNLRHLNIALRSQRRPRLVLYQFARAVANHIQPHAASSGAQVHASPTTFLARRCLPETINNGLCQVPSSPHWHRRFQTGRKQCRRAHLVLRVFEAHGSH